MRIRVRYASSYQEEQKFWFWVHHAEVITVAELSGRLADHLGLGRGRCLQLFLEAFALPPRNVVADVLHLDEVVDVLAADEPACETGVATQPATEAEPLPAAHGSPDASAAGRPLTQLSARRMGKAEQQAWLSPLPDGACYIPDLLTPEDEAAILQWVDRPGGSWSKEISRRTQQYGPRFAYGGGRYLQHNDDFPNIPSVFDNVIWKLRSVVTEDGHCLYRYQPDQIIINEYYPGQGIAAHIDRTELFDDCIASVSLLSDAVMNFMPVKRFLNGVQQAPHNVLLHRRSALVMTGPARYHFKHGIQRLREEVYLQPDGVEATNVRSRRVSITLRRVLPAAQPKPPNPDPPS
mmetsp:Transcript_115889/g.201653  ORF Transcript_115889/g.201653 Transcript_115889/m.201653 type:complete len:350 (-) Transcript_115889:249-1298(-)